MPTYEEIFLAIAVKNRLLTMEEATECIAHAGRPGSRTSIEEVVRQKELLSDTQVRAISEGARKMTSSIPIPPLAPPPPPPPPKRVSTDPNEPIPGVRIVNRIGVGGTATVFLAEQPAVQRRVALKVIHPSLARDEKALRRFQREAELLIQFDHPNLVKGFEQGMMGPLAYFLMENLEGESAQEVLDREKRFPEARALEIIQDVARAIDYMQARGMIHRDIKPGNIFILKDGSVKVLDLGFAQSVGEGAGEEETTSGTAQYMSPEQARGQRDLDVRADIYSLGATLYHMVMGELPFAGTDSLEVMAKQVLEALNSTELKNRHISRHMHYFIERMMSKDKDLRYATPKDLIEDVTQQIEGFRSLEYHPEDEQSKTTSATRFLSEPQAPAGRRLRPPTTRRTLPNGGAPRYRRDQG